MKPNIDETSKTMFHSNRMSAAIVTGGGRGIGRSITLRLAREQPVVVVGRTESDLQQICNEVELAGGTAIACVGDIADRQVALDAVASAHDRGWSIQHLVCNAGIGKSGSTAEFDPGLWQRIFDVNVHGCFHFVQATLPDLLKHSNGVITIVSSMVGLTGVSHDAAYSASKHALVGLAKSLALEYRKQGLTIAALCPSFIESEMTDRTIQSLMRRQGLSKEDAMKRIADHCPGRRIFNCRRPRTWNDEIRMICNRVRV
jgi:NAD(P)-dependent dehydrogenase (short-subunit alcohol dehydrogenase family)